MVRIRREERDWLGVALATAAGLGAGFLVGVTAGEFLGDVVSDRFRKLRRTTSRDTAEREAETASTAETVEGAVSGALSEHPTTRGLPVLAHALGDGIVELTGRVPDRASRELAGTVARGVAGVDVIVNRILVEDEDLPSGRPSRAG
jgi:osmotically-inducible protein OsmY